MSESIKALEIETSILFTLAFANNTILSFLSFFFLVIDLYVLIPAVFAQISNLIAEIVTPRGVPSTEVKADQN